MSYAELLLGKELDKLSFGDIEEYFTIAKAESDKLEFKSYGSGQRQSSHKEKESGILRTICAMLNSLGGLIIWGAPEGKACDIPNEKIFVGALSTLPERIEKDSFISRISDLITPTPTQIRFHRVEKNREYAYIIEVNQSPYAPHQFQNTYFMRLDGQSRPAPHHYIEALFRKITYPNLEGYAKILKRKKSYEGGHLVHEFELAAVLVNMSELQNEENVYFEISTSIGSFSNFADSHQTNGYSSVKKYNEPPILHFKAPHVHYVTLYVSDSNMSKHGHRGEIMLFFGGKKSPIRVSKYSFDFNSTSTNKEADVLEVSENQLLSEIANVKSFSPKRDLDIILRPFMND